MKYKFLARFYYIIGDISWRIFATFDRCFLRVFIPYFFWEWYQICMLRSITYDKKAGFTIWKTLEDIYKK